MPYKHIMLCCSLLFLHSNFPSSGSFPISRLFSSGGQSIGASASASVPPKNIPGWFPLGLTGFISLKSREFSRVFSNTTIWKKILWCSVLFMVQLLQPGMTTRKIFDYRDCCQQNDVSTFYILSGFVMEAFLPRNKCLLISWLQSPSAVILEPKEICHCFQFFPLHLPWSNGTVCCDLSFLNVEF